MIAVISVLTYSLSFHSFSAGGNFLASADGCIKIADFGISVSLDKTLGRQRTVIGTPHWMAPEVLTSDDYDEKADIWSLGITAYELAIGEPPHAKLHSMRAALKIPQCIGKDDLVMLYNRQVKPASQVQINDQLMSWSPVTGEFGPRPSHFSSTTRSSPGRVICNGRIHFQSRTSSRARSHLQNNRIRQDESRWNALHVGCLCRSRPATSSTHVLHSSTITA